LRKAAAIVSVAVLSHSYRSFDSTHLSRDHLDIGGLLKLRCLSSIAYPSLASSLGTIGLCELQHGASFSS
jgi:hypothetical protein